MEARNQAPRHLAWLNTAIRWRPKGRPMWTWESQELSAQVSRRACGARVQSKGPKGHNTANVNYMGEQTEEAISPTQYPIQEERPHPTHHG